jgi:Mor family transcriptional regulator
MGTAPLPKTDRNQNLLNDHRAGLGIVRLVSKYRITPQRIYQIIKANKEHEVHTQNP